MRRRASARSACGDSQGYAGSSFILLPSSFILHPSKQPRSIEVDVRQEERHGAALGDFPSFVQVALCALRAGARAGETPQAGAGEEAVGRAVLRAGTAQAV